MNFFHHLPASTASGLFLLCVLLIDGLPAAQAQQPPGNALEQQQLQRQQEREQALRERMAPSTDVLRPKAAAQVQDIPLDETPCFALHRLQLAGEQLDQVPWLAAAAGMDWQTHPCIGVQGVQAILTRMQQAVLERGYVTSRVVAGAQNLQDGVLTITFLPGVLRHAEWAEDSVGGAGRTSLAAALPARRGALLQLRDIEQGLENLQRVPGARADIQIIPAQGADAQPGQSDLHIIYHRAAPLRLNLAVDNGGTQATGKTQGTATVSWDNPLGLSDLAYLSLGGGIGNGSHRGTRTQAAQYSVPLGYWLLSLGGSRNTYNQRVAGAYQHYTYSGESSSVDAQLSRVIHRSASSKTTLGVKVFQRSSRNYIDDTEIEVQRRRTSGYALSLHQRNHIGAAVLDAHLSLQRGTGAFRALPAPEEPWGEGSSRMKLYTADLALIRPFTLGGTRLQLSSVWHGQTNQTPLTPQDRIGIGGRYTVRGFDGESTLLAERGWYWRNDLSLPFSLGAAGQAEVFLGLDTGKVSGPSARHLVGTALTGAAIGLRGAWQGLSWEVSLATPLRKPEYLSTPSTYLALQLAYSF